MHVYQIQPYEVIFETSRSSGPGGQNVNKTESRVTALWYLNEAPIPEKVKTRLFHRYPGYITADGFLRVSCQEHRSQAQNREASVVRLQEMLNSVWKDPIPRRATKPTKASVKRRLSAKKRDSRVKKLRKVTSHDD